MALWRDQTLEGDDNHDGEINLRQEANFAASGITRNTFLGGEGNWEQQQLTLGHGPINKPQLRSSYLFSHIFRINKMSYTTV
jgi:hypothetical protein